LRLLDHNMQQTEYRALQQGCAKNQSIQNIHHSTPTVHTHPKTSFPDFYASIPAGAYQQLAHTLHCCQLSDAVCVHLVLHPQLAAEVGAAVRCGELGAFTQAAFLDHRHTCMHVATVAVHVRWDLHESSNNKTPVLCRALLLWGLYYTPFPLSA
jgi:hypothetical protein